MSSTLVPTTNQAYASAALAVADMNAELKVEFDAIKDKINKATAHNLSFYNWLGKRAATVHGNTAKYGSGAIDKLAAGIDYDRSILYKCMTFHALYPTDPELKALTERRSKVGDKPITWSHMFALVHVDRAAVFGLVDEFFKHGWTVRELHREIRRRAFGGATGPRPTPRTVLGGLSQFLSMSTRLSAKFEEEFDQSVADPLAGIDGGQINDQLLQRVRASGEALRDLAERSGKRAAELDELLKGLEKTAADTAKEAAKEAAGDAPEPAPKAKPKSAPRPKAKAKVGAAKAKKTSKPEKAGKPGRSRHRRPIPA